MSHNKQEDWGGIDLSGSIRGMLALFVLIGMAAAEDVGDSIILFQEEKNLTFTMDQKVSGTGFFSTYKYALMPDALGTEGSLFLSVH